MGATTKKIKTDILPRSAESVEGGKYLRDLLETGVPNIPARPFADYSPLTRGILDALPENLKRTQSNLALAEGEYKKTLGDQYDPRTSPFYQGLRAEAKDIKAASATAARQRGTLAGVSRGSAAQTVEAENARKLDEALLSQLGGIFERERGRKTEAAGALQDLESNRLGIEQAYSNISDLDRAMEQARSDALYDTMIEQIMMPYNQMANIALTMMGYDPGTITTGGGAKDWVTDVAVISKMYGGTQSGQFDSGNNFSAGQTGGTSQSTSGAGGSLGAGAGSTTGAQGISGGR